MIALPALPSSDVFSPAPVGYFEIKVIFKNHFFFKINMNPRRFQGFKTRVRNLSWEVVCLVLGPLRAAQLHYAHMLQRCCRDGRDISSASPAPLRTERLGCLGCFGKARAEQKACRARLAAHRAARALIARQVKHTAVQEGGPSALSDVQNPLQSGECWAARRVRRLTFCG